MFSTLRTRFGIPGVISVMALVFAMFGGAYAASNGNGGGKATASAKGKQGPRGPKGPKGAAGPAGAQGPAGPQGPAGAKGDAGVNGFDGAAGAPGTNGKSVVTLSFEGTDEPADEPCLEQGGNSIEVEGSGIKRYACNGTAGANGSPWTAGGTLPPGSTETGAYSFFSAEPAEASFAYAPISFSVPLAHPLDSSHVVLVKLDENPDPTHCAGSQAEPKAASGYLCVYGGGELGGKSVSINIPINGGGVPGAGTTGALIKFSVHGELEPARSNGVFAVTG